MVFGLRLGLPKKAAPAEAPHHDTVSTTKKIGGEPTGSSVLNTGKNALTVNEFVARTKRCREKGLEPTKPELIAYARYLGVDPVIDADLMWIVDEALNSPLPSEWTEHHDSADRVFYYNTQTHASAWTHPLEHLHRDTYKRIVNFRSGDLTKEEQTKELESVRATLEEDEAAAHKELQAWTEHTDDQGQKFYYNRNQTRSVWTDPRPARCHTLYLQMKALRVLCKHCGQSAGVTSARPEPIGLGSPSASSSAREGREPLLSTNNKSSSAAAMPLARGEDIKSMSFSRNNKLEVSNDLFNGDGGNMDKQDEHAGGEKRKRKKKEDRSAKRETGSSANQLSCQSTDSDPVELRRTPLEMKKPNLSAAEEVRAVLGAGHGTFQPSRGPLIDSSRLPTPPGDGLNTVGRAKVRAGIRLEPLS